MIYLYSRNYETSKIIPIRWGILKAHTLMSELTCDIEKPYYIGHKQGIKLENCLSYMENDFWM